MPTSLPDPTRMNFHLVIFDPDSDTVFALRSAFAGVPSITVEKTKRMRYMEPPDGIDVLYLPLPAAERWGSKPVVHQSQVLPVPKKGRGGLPAFIVTGTCLAQNDPRGPVPETTLLIRSAFEAIRVFNDQNTIPLERVGFWAYNLLKGISASQLKAIISSVVPELNCP